MEGYRGWRLENGRLTSYNNFVWTSSTMKAECNHGCDIEDCIEHHQCSCGFYAKNSLEEIISYPKGFFDIYGLVYQFGSVMVGQNGQRSSHLAIRVLYTADFSLAQELKAMYPDVEIQMPPAALIRHMNESQATYTYQNDDWQKRMARKQERERVKKEAIEAAKKKYPGGPDEEKKRIAKLLRGASRYQIQDFAKKYGSSPEFAERNWLGKVENSKKAKPGDIVFEANDDTKPYVFIGSTRPNQYSSMRWLLSYNGLLYKRPNIRKWDEDPEFLESRKRAMEEWE